MRTTLEIDDDLLAAAKSLAAQRHETLGTVVSSLLRKALRPKAARVRNGVPVFTPEPGAATPSMHLVNALRDEEP